MRTPIGRTGLAFILVSCAMIVWNGVVLPQGYFHLLWFVLAMVGMGMFVWDGGNRD